MPPSPTPTATAAPTNTPTPTATPGPGALRWKFETRSWVDAAPIIHEGVIYIGSQDGTLYGLEPDTGSRVWSYQAGGGITGAAAFAEGVVFVPSLDNNLHAVNLESAELLWKFEAEGELWASPTISGGVVYIGSVDDHLYAIDVEDGTLVWKYKTGDDLWTGANTADGTIFVGSYDFHVHALDAGNGEVRWKSDLGVAILSRPAVADGLVYVGSWDHLYALDASTGDMRWNFWAGDALFTSPVVQDGVVYIGSDDGFLYALDAEEGTLKWRFATDDKVRSSPTVSDGVVYVGSNDGHLYAVSAVTGALVWRFKTNGEVAASPVAVGGSVYVGSRDNSVYAVATDASQIAGMPQTVQFAAATSTEFAPLTSSELKDLLDEILTTDLPALGARSFVTVGETTTVTQLSFVYQAVKVFETGYFLLTGVTPREEGWIPRVLSLEGYIDLIRERAKTDPELLSVAGYCCYRTSEGLELIIKGDVAVHSVITTMAHEAGHARQKIINPVQIWSSRESNLAAIKEAEAFAFEAAILRTVGEHAGINATKFPLGYDWRTWIESWTASWMEDRDDLTEEHQRGRALLWMAVVHDPELTALKGELESEGILSPKSLLALHDRLIQVKRAEADGYVEGLLERLGENTILILETLLKRNTSLPLEGFVEHSSDLFLVP